MSHSILFDLDGTLVDSYPGIADAYRFTFDAMGIDGGGDLDMHPFVGPSIREVLKGHFGFEGALLEEGVRLFRAEYGSNGLYRFTKYEGVDETLESLKALGYELSIATGKLWTMAVDVIRHAGWTDLFSVIGGAESDGTRYLKQDVIEWTLNQLPSDSTAFAMIGDRAADIVGGRIHGLTGVGVTWGYGEAPELEEAGAEMLAHSPTELTSIIRAVQP